MVLSNKKLKQKLRAAKAELVAGSGAQNSLADKDSEKPIDSNSKISDSLSILLNKDAQKPVLSKREKRRQNVQLRNSEISKNGEMSSDTVGKNKIELNSDEVETKKKKKRKRDESKESDNVKEKKAVETKKKKKSKKVRKPKKKTGNGQVTEEMGEGKESRPNGQQLVAKADESISRRNDAVVADKVYVGGIPYYSTEDDIRSYFEGCGTITSVDCMTFPDTGKFRGIAIITFKTEAAAKRALALDGSDMGGLFLKIKPFKPAKADKLPNFSPTVLEGYNRIYIGNLSWDITEDDLKKLFSDCSISSIRFGEDKETGEFKGYAHVDFSDSLSLKKALKLDQNVVCGRPVKISCAVPKKGTVSKSKSAPLDNQVESSVVPRNGTVPKLQPLPAENQVDSSKVSTVTEAQGTTDGANGTSSASAMSSKIRRRTCYECGEKGHLSSSCPKKLAADLTVTSAV